MNNDLRLALSILRRRLMVAVGCQKKTLVKGVELEVTFGEPTLSDNLITEVEYKWKTGDDFQPNSSSDYSVFVHFWHNTNLLLQDDYIPEVPTSKWEKGKEYTGQAPDLHPRFHRRVRPPIQGRGNAPLLGRLLQPL